MEPLEATMIDIILQHPEYHEMLAQPEIFQSQDFETHNPFLHLSLHLALNEQIASDTPSSIRNIYETLCKKFANRLMAEHQMIECLEKILWEAQSTQVQPDEENYLKILRKLI